MVGTVLSPPNPSAALSREIQALDSADPATRSEAAKRLGEMGPAAKDAVPRLVELAFFREGAPPEESQVRTDAWQAVVKLGPVAAPYLANLAVHDPDPPKRVHALTLLGNKADTAPPFAARPRASRGTFRH